MARKRRYEEHENHERWLVSYADFITLLFAFFVVMYSISSVNDGKYRVLSETLSDAFLTSAQSLDPIQVGEKVRTVIPVAGEYAAPEFGTTEFSKIEALKDDVEKRSDAVESKDDPDAIGKQGDGKNGELKTKEKLDVTAESLKSALAPFINEDLVSVIQTDRGIEVEMKSKMLFTSASARLSRTAIRLLRDVADIIKPLPNRIMVEGHTDNLPIRTILFPSNWELSAARAASVVHLLSRFKVNPERLAAVGYGEHRPIASNANDADRQKNRRVALIIKTLGTRRIGGDIDDVRERGVQ